MRVVSVAFLLFSCTSDPAPIDIESDDTDTGETDDTDTGETDDTDTDDTDTDDTDTGDTGPPPPAPLRLVALGDGGEGNDSQYAVARAVKTICDRDGCDLALYLGDNFYDDGVDSLDDPQWDAKFESPYSDLDFPFYAVLGNHDNGGFGGAGFEFWRGDIQVDYAASGRSDKFTMPDRFYTYKPENTQVMLIGLDTNALMFDQDVEDQARLVEADLRTSDRPVSIAFGHHPYISNGKHGNAGKYEGISGLPIVSGKDVKQFIDRNICGQVDVYISGHDHNLQWLGEADGCETEFLVSGAAAKKTDLEGRGNLTYFETDKTPGFIWLEVTGEKMLGRIYDQDGKLLFEHTKKF